MDEDGNKVASQEKDKSVRKNSDKIVKTEKDSVKYLGNSKGTHYDFEGGRITNLNIYHNDGTGTSNSPSPSPSSVIRMREPISHMKETESFKSILSVVTKEPKVILHCCGVPGSGKSQIVRKLAEKFPFAADESQDSKHNAIKWHIQCKDSGHDVLEKMKELTGKLQKNGHITKEKYQSIDDDLDNGITLSLVKILVDCIFPVLITVEDPSDTSSKVLVNLFRSLKNCKTNRQKIHVYVASRTKTSILNKQEIGAMKESGIYKEKTVSGFEEEEAVDYLSEGHKGTDRSVLVEIVHRFGGLPLGLQAAKGYCERAMIDYMSYLELVKQTPYNMIEHEREEIEKEYGDCALHIFQAIVLPFIPTNSSDDITSMLHWKILSCLSYFNYDRIPRSAIEYCCHMLRTSSIQKPDIVDRADVGMLISKLVNLHMCTVTDETEVTFHEGVATSFRLNQNSLLEPSFHPLKKAIEIMSGLVTKDMRKKEHCQKMYKLRRHLQSLLEHVEQDEDLYDGEDSVMLKALTSHLYETAAAIMLNESSALFLEESDKYFRKALSYIWEGEDLTKVKDKPDEIVKTVSETLVSKAEELPVNFALKYASKLDISLNKEEIEFFRKKTLSRECFEKVQNCFKSKASKEETIEKLQKCGLFLSNEKYRQIFYLERVASILHSWSRLVLYMESEKVQSDERCMWLTWISNSIASECRIKFGVTLLIERLSQTGGLIPIVLKQKKNVDDRLKSLGFCKKMLSEKEDVSDMHENGMLKEVYGPSYVSTRITLLRHTVRINARLIKDDYDSIDLSEADSKCNELFDLAVKNSSKISISILCIINCAKYHAAKGDFGKSMECFQKFFDVAELDRESKSRYNTKCWAVYNYARAVCCQPTLQAESIHDALAKCQQVQDEPELMSKDLNGLLKRKIEDLQKMM